jgi:transcriptional regulator of arginine metabolism
MSHRNEEWQERWSAIESILGKEAVRNQTELLQRLKKLGFRVTQPSVSRDLQEMGVAKVGGRYVLAKTLSGEDRPTTRLAEVALFVQKVTPAGPHLLVVRTTTGTASSVALAIDGAGWPEIVGTVAGDDTLFIATTGRGHQLRVHARIAALAKESKSE